MRTMTIPDQIPPAELERMLDEGYPKEPVHEMDMRRASFEAYLVVTGHQGGDGPIEWPATWARPVWRGGPDYSGRAS